MKIDGKEIAEKIFEELKERVARLAEDGESRLGELERKNLPASRQGVIPHLAVILVGANPASIAYVTLKQKKERRLEPRCP